MVKICNSNTPYPAISIYNEVFARYPYPLSDFQKYAIEAILRGHHVLVTAHTGSGKTLPAEFAIEHFVGRGKKVIYTSPIKALSNQKYYEFQQKYPHISFGLFTGDIKTNPEADVLIMTTEILMNYLFIKDTNLEKKETETENKKEKDKNIDLEKTTFVTPDTQFKINIDLELAAVVFDEVHYINDADRGQTWEKTIMMLPEHIQKIMLSATIDSPERFADWCERSGKERSGKERSGKDLGKDLEEDAPIREVYLCSTNHRVVPLTHYGYMTISESTLKSIKDKSLQQEMRNLTGDLIKIQTDKGVFLETGYKTIKKISEFIEKHAFLKRKFVLNQLCQFLKNREMLPAIAFVFSRKQVEICAQEITIPLLEDDSKIPYIVSRECKQIIMKLPNYEEYLNLPEYISLVALLEKGIGIHHSGMIPILREIVELMISKKYIKLLFATESFAIGLDCPIKTAIFTGLQKFDGNDMRYVYSHEYTQMAGRAGRRGIDTIGHVVHCNNLFPLPAKSEYENMLCGKPQTLISKFRISYSWVLNLLQSGDHMIDMTKKSMIYEELQETLEKQRTCLATLNTELNFKKNKLALLRTPVDICKKYLELDKSLKTAVNKKRKEIEREIDRIKMDHRYIAEEANQVQEVTKLEYVIEYKEIPHLEYLETYVDNQMNHVLSVLLSEEFVTNDNNTTELLEKGKMACKLAEVHPLVWTECICNKWENMAKFTVKQIVGIFSCMTDVKVKDEYRLSVPSTEDGFLKHRILELKEEYERYSNIECAREMRTGIDYDNVLLYDIIDESMEWCDCKTEEECKWFIQTKLGEKEISIGDFTKAMMKIATISKEFMQCMEDTDWQYKLSLIDEAVLKFIATSQSLYV